VRIDLRVQNICEVYFIVFVGEALIVLSDISKIVEVASRKFIEDLLVLTLWWVAVFLHKVVSDAEGKALYAHIPVHIPNVERKVAPRIERKRLKHLCVSLLLINILYVDEVTEGITDVLHLFPNFL
jgi:hypothetical protein